MRIHQSFKELYALAKRQGWEIEKTRSGHLRWRSPAGLTVITPGSPGRGRSTYNTKADLKRAGLRIERG